MSISSSFHWTKFLENLQVQTFTNDVHTQFPILFNWKKTPLSLTWQLMCSQYFCAISDFCFQCGVVLNYSSHFCHMHCFEEMKPALHIKHSGAPACVFWKRSGFSVLEIWRIFFALEITMVVSVLGKYGPFTVLWSG